MNEKISVVKTLRGLLRILCSDFSSHFFRTILLGILHGISSGFVVIFTQRFFEQIQTGIRNNYMEMPAAFSGLLALGGIIILEYFMIALHNSEIEKYSFMMDKLFLKKMQDRVMHLDSLDFESKEMVEKISNAKKERKMQHGL